MAIATKQQLMGLRGPEPLIETVSITGTDLQVIIKGIVRSAERSAIYSEIDEMVGGINSVVVDGQRIPVTEDDIVAACWSSACVQSPILTSMEWLMVGATNCDLLAAVGFRSLVCSRLLADGDIPDGVAGAGLSLTGDNRDPLDSSPSSSVSRNLEGCLENSTR